MWRYWKHRFMVDVFVVVLYGRRKIWKRVVVVDYDDEIRIK
jgi:hypothetical protein